MSNSNEKLVTAIAALVPIARDAFKNGHLTRQFDAVLQNSKVRHAGSDMAAQAEKYVRDSLKSNKFARQIASRMAPRPSPLPAIAITLMGAGLVWAYLERRKVRKQSGAAPMSNGKTDMTPSGVTFDATATPSI